MPSSAEHSERAVDPQNQLPEWVMCSDLDGRNVAVFPKSSIVKAIAAGFDLWQRSQQTPRNTWGKQYPKFYWVDDLTPANTGNANRE